MEISSPQIKLLGLFQLQMDLILITVEIWTWKLLRLSYFNIWRIYWFLHHIF